MPITVRNTVNIKISARRGVMITRGRSIIDAIAEYTNTE
jgi:hypothetical protein